MAFLVDQMGQDVDLREILWSDHGKRWLNNREVRVVGCSLYERCLGSDL